MPSFAMLALLLVFQQQPPAPAQAPAPADQLPGVGQLKAPPPKVQDPSVPPLISLPSLFNQEMPNEPLTADEAARIALKLQPSIQAAIGSVKQAHGITVQDESQLLPQVLVGGGADFIHSLSGRGTELQAPFLDPILGISEVYRYQGIAQFRQLIYDFDHTREIVRKDQDIARAQEENLTAQQLQVILNVKQAYYDYANAERVVKVDEDNVVNRQRQLDLANARFQNGIGEPIDVVNAETSKSQGIVQLTLARNAASQAATNLLNQIGVNPLTPINVPPASSEAEVSGDDPKALISTALKARPEVRAAQALVNAYGHGVSAAKTVDMPSFYVAGAAGAAGNKFPLSNDTAALGLGVSFPIFDSGLRAGSVEQAEGQLQSAQASFNTTVLSVQNDVANAYVALRTAEQTLELTDKEVANAQEGVRIAEGRYKENFGQFQDILTAQSLLLGAETDQTQAQNAVDQARTQLRHAMGVMFSDRASSR